MPKIAQPAPNRRWMDEEKQRSGLTWEEFAKKAETPYSTIMDYRSGDRNPCVTQAKRIANLVGFDWKLFFEETAS